MIRAKPWNGEDLKGTWEVTLKIDGVRALWNGDEDEGVRGWYSRAGKPLYNIPPWQHGMPTDCEVFLGDFKSTIRAVRTKKPRDVAGCKLKKCKCVPEPRYGREFWGDCKNWEEASPVIKPEHLFSLDPMDVRLGYNAVRRALGEPLARGILVRYMLVDPCKQTVTVAMERAVAAGYEGLVLRQVTPRVGMVRYEEWLKVKPKETYDVLVTGAIEGTGKHKGRLGALMTSKGKVGTGFSDEEREDLWRLHLLGKTTYRGRSPRTGCAVERIEDGLIGSTIEVSCMQFTADGKFRHPRFVRMRPDKIAEE